MMLLDELIQMMIGMSDDQLLKIKSFILMKLSIKDPTDTRETAISSCPICITILSKTAREMANSNFSVKSANTLSALPPILSPSKANILLNHGRTMFQA